MSDVTIGSQRIGPRWQGGSAPRLRGFVKRSFEAFRTGQADPVLMVAGSPFNNSGEAQCFIDVPLTIDNEGYLVSPQFIVPSTTDSPDHPTDAAYQFFAYVPGAEKGRQYLELGTLSAGLRVPPAPLMTKFSQLISFTSGTLPPDNNWNVNVTGVFSVAGATTHNGAVTNNAGQTTNGATVANGPTTLNGNATVNGDLIVRDALAVNSLELIGPQAFPASLSVAADVTIGDDLTVGDDASIGGDASVGGALNVGGAGEFGGNVTALKVIADLSDATGLPGSVDGENFQSFITNNSNTRKVNADGLSPNAVMDDSHGETVLARQYSNRREYYTPIVLATYFTAAMLPAGAPVGSMARVLNSVDNDSLKGIYYKFPSGWSRLGSEKVDIREFDVDPFGNNASAIGINAAIQQAPPGSFIDLMVGNYQIEAEILLNKIVTLWGVGSFRGSNPNDYIGAKGGATVLRWAGINGGDMTRVVCSGVRLRGLMWQGLPLESRNAWLAGDNSRKFDGPNNAVLFESSTANGGGEGDWGIDDFNITHQGARGLFTAIKVGYNSTNNNEFGFITNGNISGSGAAVLWDKGSMGNGIDISEGNFNALGWTIDRVWTARCKNGIALGAAGHHRIGLYLTNFNYCDLRLDGNFGAVTLDDYRCETARHPIINIGSKLHARSIKIDGYAQGSADPNRPIASTRTASPLIISQGAETSIERLIIANPDFTGKIFQNFVADTNEEQFNDLPTGRFRLRDCYFPNINMLNANDYFAGTLDHAGPLLTGRIQCGDELNYGEDAPGVPMALHNGAFAATVRNLDSNALEIKNLIGWDGFHRQVNLGFHGGAMRLYARLQGGVTVGGAGLRFSPSSEAEGTYIKGHWSATKAWNVPSTAHGAIATTTLTIAEARPGDTVEVSFRDGAVAGGAPAGVLFYGTVTNNAGLIMVTMLNMSGGVQDLGEFGEIRVDVWKH